MAEIKRYRAKYAFGVMLDGEQITIPAGEIVRGGHPLLKGRSEHFEEVTSFGRYDVETKKPETKKEPETAEVEQATAAPGEKRTKTKAK